MAETATRPTLTTTDLVAGVPVVVVGVLGTVSIALAHLDAHSLPLVLLVSLVALAALGALLARRRPRVSGDRNGVLACLACGAVAGVMFLPGFSYGVSDKDPGAYVAHAVEIARNGSYDFVDPALAHPTLPVEVASPGARLPAMWVDDADSGRIVPQFYHLWPALLATSYDAAGFGGVTATTPLIGVVAVMALVGLLRRVGGLWAGAIGGVLLATNMMQVWQAKYPTTEILAQALFLGTLLGVVIAAQERWRPAAYVAGLLVGVGFLNRADGWLLVMLSAATLGALWISRRADGEVAWGAAGLATLLPYGLWQGYGPAHQYTVTNHIPDLTKTLALLALVAAGAVAGRLVLRRPVAALVGWGTQRRTQLAIGLAVCAACFLLLVVGFMRPRIFGEDYYLFQGRQVRSYDEHNMHRLAWFFTLPGFALAGLGVAVVALRRWTLAAWTVVLPTLLLLPVFAWHSRNSSRLMWWARRYVSNVLPGVIVLIALALAFAIAWQWKGRRPLRLPAFLAAGGLAAVFLSQSLPVRSHDEFAGSFGVAERVSRAAGDERGVFLWQRLGCCLTHTQLWATPLWLHYGEVSVMLPGQPERQAEYVKAYQAAFPDDPVFVVWAGATPPDSIPGLTPVDRLTGTVPFWQESDVKRPDAARPIPYDFTVYRVG